MAGASSKKARDDSTEIFAKIEAFSGWRLGNDGLLPVWRPREGSIEQFWYNWMISSGRRLEASHKRHMKLTLEEAEAFKLAVRPNSAETSHDIMCSISAFSTWRASNQGLLPVRSIADLQSTWYRWLERMSCRLQGTYNGQPQLSPAEADAFCLAIRPNTQVSSLSKGWSRPSYVDAFPAYTEFV